MPAKKERPADYSCGELRDRARTSRSENVRAEALAELRRRIRNLRSAVVPAWERELRGARLEDWELV